MNKQQTQTLIDWYDEHKTVMRAFADGKKIQCRNPHSEGITSKWGDVDSPTWNPEYEYRVKPERRRVYVIYTRTGLMADYYSDEGTAKDRLKALNTLGHHGPYTMSIFVEAEE